MQDLKDKIDELAALMEEFGLAEAEIAGSDWKVAFRKTRRVPKSTSESGEEQVEYLEVGYSDAAASAPTVDARPAGTPVTSPMNGIFFPAPSPSAAPFVRTGEAVTAGQVVGLIEAMKVFNEIVAPTSGIVDRVVAESGQLVQPGDPLLYIV